MKKLRKKLYFEKCSLQAYYCGCSCGCNCGCYTSLPITQAQNQSSGAVFYQDSTLMSGRNN